MTLDRQSKDFEENGIQDLIGKLKPCLGCESMSTGNENLAEAERGYLFLNFCRRKKKGERESASV